MEFVGSLTDYEKLKKAEMAVVSVWPYVQKLMQLENEVSQLKAKIDDKKNLIIGIVLSIIPLAFLIGIPMVIVWVVNYSKNKGLVEAKEQELAQATEQYNDACRTYTTELTYVSGEYRYPDAVRYMVHEFDLEKVHTLGEAYKAYDEYDWRKKQEMQFVDLKSLLSNANAQLSSLQYQMIMNNVIGSVNAINLSKIGSKVSEF